MVTAASRLFFCMASRPGGRARSCNRVGGAVKLRIAADASAKAANGPLTILVTEPGKANVVTSSSAIGADKAGGERLINEVNHLWLTVKPKPPKPKKESK